MHKLILFLLALLATRHCTASTFDTDTIDNWQIYNGDVLIMAGNGDMGDGLQTSLRYNQLKDIRVVYRQCMAPSHKKKVTLWAVVPADKASLSWTKEFTEDGEYIIPLEEYGPKLKGRESLTIYYSGSSTQLGKKLGKIFVVPGGS